MTQPTNRPLQGDPTVQRVQAALHALRDKAQPSPEHPLYEAVPQETTGATQFFMVTCNEGWRSSIVCTGMYPWAARWLVDQIQGRPYAPGERS